MSSAYLIARPRQIYCAIPTRLVERVLPFSRWSILPDAPPHVAGLLNYHGDSIPVVDLALLLEKNPCEAVIGARIILGRFPLADTGKLLALAVEEVEGLRQIPESLWQPPGAAPVNLACLGRVTPHPEGAWIQEITTLDILSEEDKQSLYAN